LAKKKPTGPARGNQSWLKTNLDPEKMAENMSRAGFNVIPPSGENNTAFWTISFDKKCNAQAQLYASGVVLLRWATLEDEATALQLLTRYARTRDGDSLQMLDYAGHGSKMEAADDLIALHTIALLDNLNLEKALGILARDMVELAKTGKIPGYLDSLSSLPQLVQRSRLNDPLVPISGLVIQTLDPGRKLGRWERTDDLPIPNGTFARSFRNAAATLRNLSLDPKKTSEYLASQPVSNFQRMIQRNALLSYRNSANRENP
jgi:hypothetical protein